MKNLVCNSNKLSIILVENILYLIWFDVPFAYSMRVLEAGKRRDAGKGYCNVA